MPRERVKHGDMFLFEKQDSSDTSVPPSIDDMVGRPWLPGEPQPENTILREEPSLDIHWNRDGEYVQVAFDAPRDYWERFWKSRENDKELVASSVFTDRLSRKEINHMIRTLRRARDSAYGADE